MPFPLVYSPARFEDLSLSPLPVLGCLDILSPQFRLSGIALAWSMVLFTEPHQHRRRLRAGGLALGGEGAAVAGAADDPRAAGPLEGGDGTEAAGGEM